MRDYRSSVIGLCISLPILAIIFVLLRFHARRIKKASLGPDDFAVVVALFLAIGFAIVVLIDEHLGDLGGHQKYTSEGLPVTPSRYTEFWKTDWVAQIFWYATVGVTKISILLLYRRIFGVSQRFRGIVWFLIVLVSLWTIAFELVTIFSCNPISSSWIFAQPAKCVDKVASYTAGSVTDVVGDIAILTLPIFEVYNLQMATTRKIAVSGIFLLGFLVTIAGVVRLAYVIKAFDTLRSEKLADVTYEFAPAIFWTQIETSLGVISACLPVLRPLYQAYSIDSILKSARAFRSLSGSTAKESSGKARGRTSSAGSQNSQSALSGKATFDEQYYINRDKHDYHIPMNSLHIEGGASQPKPHSQPVSGIIVKSEVVQKDNLV